MARTRWILGLQRRLVRTWEWDTDMPQDGPLPQTSHTAAMLETSLYRRQASGLTDAEVKTTSETKPTPTVPGPKTAKFAYFPPRASGLLAFRP
jgi:hypothetical protein